MPSQATPSELWKTALNWLKLSGNNINKNYCKEEITTHPDYPALSALTDFLETGGMKYSAVEADASYIDKFNYPLLAHIKEPGHQYLHIVTEASKWDTQKNITDKWSGIVIYTEKKSSWKHTENDTRKKEDNIQRNYGFAVLFAALGLYALSVYNNPIFSYAIFGLLSLAGLFISQLITQTELGVQNYLVKQVYGAVSNGGCDKVLKSNYAKGIADFTTGDIAIIYFAAQFFSFLITPLFPALFNPLIIFSIAGILVALVSIYTQAVILKQWCALCIGIVGVLLLQFAIAIFLISNINITHLINWQPIVTFFAIAFIIALIVSPIKKILIQNHLNKQKLAELKKWKTDASLFKIQWQLEQTVDTTIWENDLLIGDPNAPIMLTVACNPYCGPCAKAHQELDEILENFKNLLCIQMRFVCDPENENDKRTIAVKAILQKAIEFEKKETPQKMLSDWFKDMNFEKWSRNWKITKVVNVMNDLKQHDLWSKQSNIQFTPTFFVNGRKLPGRYGLNDLKILIPQLINENINRAKK